MNRLVERFAFSNGKRVGATEVYDLLQELAADVQARAEGGVQAADSHARALAELARNAERIREAQAQDFRRIGDELAAAERSLQTRLDQLGRDLSATLGQAAKEQLEAVEQKLSQSIDQMDRRIEGLAQLAEEQARRSEALDAFVRFARDSDRRQLDNVGTIAQDIEGFLRFTQVDDRSQLDQIGTLSTNIYSRLEALAQTQREAFERLSQATAAAAAVAASVAIPPPPAPKIEIQSDRNLFIIGHARSGTSILLVALNTSPDIFLFGEANLHFHEHLSDFRGWYNELQRSFGARPIKSHYCPELLPRPATSLEYLHELGKHYRWVGEKIAFGASSEDFGFDSFSRYHESRFFNSRYLCIARHPFATILSNKAMFRAVDIRPTIRSYVRTLAKIIELTSFFPNVRVLIHENINRTTFEKLESFIEADLSHAIDCYATDKQGQIPREQAYELFGERHCDLLERIWLRFLEFYDADAMTIREKEGRLSYLLLEYAEIVAGIDDEMAKERAEAEAAAAAAAAAETTRTRPVVGKASRASLKAKPAARPTKTVKAVKAKPASKIAPAGDMPKAVRKRPAATAIARASSTKA